MNRVVLVAAVWSVFVGAITAQGQDESPTLPSIFLAKPKAISEKDDELARALKDRYNAAAAELDAMHQMYLQGQINLESLYDCARRVNESALDLATRPDERVKLRTEWLEMATFLEKHIQAKYEAAIVPFVALQLAKYQTADARVKLLREKRTARPR